MTGEKLPERWFYCYVSGEIIPSANYRVCPCGQLITDRDRENGRHSAGEPIATPVGARLKAVA